MRERNKPRRANKYVLDRFVYDLNVLCAWYYHFGQFSAIFGGSPKFVTYGQTDGWTDGQTYGWTVTPS